MNQTGEIMMDEVLEASVIKATFNENAGLTQTIGKSKKVERNERISKILQSLFKKYPKCFIPYHLNRKKLKMLKPLALNIKHKIHAENPDWHLGDINIALRIYIYGRPYLSGLKAGVQRIDLQGNPTEEKVTQDQEMMAKEQLAKKAAKCEATQENQTNATASKKK